jgi:hypothetical protein
MKLRLFAPPAALALATILAPASDARACGGCFHPPILDQSESTVVTGHRMAFATSPTRTILWDQIEYSGNPKDFAWVLPVRSGAVIEASNDAFFETLEAATTVTVQSPPYQCPEITRPQSGCGLGSFAGASDSAGAGGAGGGTGPTVQVLHQGTAGPYETVTLHTTSPGALNDWLTQHGYNVDDGIQPIIDSYVGEGFDFIALRLQPGKDVRAMKPVRVVTPGAGMTLPLRMVAAGTGAHVAITLYLISEGRYDAAQYKNVTVPTAGLVWDYQAQSSNYADIRKTTLGQNAGMTWLTAFAQQGALLSPLTGPDGGYVDYGGYGGYDDYGSSYTQTLASAYVVQGVKDGEATDTSCANVLEGLADSTALVVDPCPLGVPSDDPSCGTVAAGQTDARTLACGGLDDMKAIFTGMHPRDVWVTRIEADLPRLALASDLTIEPAAAQLEVSNFIQAPTGINADTQCPTSVPPLSMIAPGYGKAAGSGRALDRTAIFGYALIGLLFGGALVRRRRR